MISPVISFQANSLRGFLRGMMPEESNVFPKDQLMMVLERYGFDLDGELMSTIEQDVFSDVFDRELRVYL